ncbi:uncharacterized protein BO88DRAFT_445135 [Aspergillus vadensis CBS 113365]|uniref:Uncharacterized protein n=1 Tax=Aspergillus vadensis (strain CBS 113365 / IMI 142717 / IBT 24658) TaxID=1448311 RepID=A0A319B9C4_ASPVC|nr:hypothetical protein BO88DRAFT_445135 [Aspergillus vadensis CBS 113365]PYH67050.1 hypothetical protein BO88DRAFT_445135 [Aspergillus vadensis CBS 113365]
MIVRKLKSSYFLNFHLANRSLRASSILYICVIYPDHLTAHYLANPRNKEAAARARSLEKLISIKLNSTLDSSESRKFFIYTIHIIFTTITAVPVDPEILQLPDFCLTINSITLILIILHITVGLPERERDLKALSDGIYLKNLHVLEINTVSSTEDYLARLFLVHKITLYNIYLELIELPTLESWKSLLKTIQDELCLDHLEITDCEASNHIIMFSGKQKETLNNLIRILILEKII